MANLLNGVAAGHTRVIVRSSFSPPTVVDLSMGQGESEDGSGLSKAILGVVRPSVEHVSTGIRIEPWGSPTDWRIPTAILVGLAAYGLYRMLRK